ncbi:MAG: PD40 domain-containing protein [Ardenticatenaceae bacterium]|nr:PD40 domain-containing protein [Anaerolineales bacterium]MCB8942069.1 PD40 domain-containing protein [Ardenticatenaceae bacterium]MCB8973171.1 PD40 domain-containing protein [Ardenticatenaceae bacterium]
MKRRQILLWLWLVGLLMACGGGVETAVPTETEFAGGTIYFILQEPHRQALMRYDVAADSVEPLFEVPVNAWISHMAASPDGSQIALTYAPSPGENEIQFGYSSLYLLLADGRSEPRPLIERTADQEVFFNPAWSPDGAWLYYTHVTPLDEITFTFATHLERFELATGTTEVLAENGIWPRVSPDGRFLTYVNIDRDSLAAELVVADADGRNPTVLVPRNRFVTLDSPFFSADGAWLYFSAVAQQTSSASWWEQLLGIEVALAHDLPSTWWRIPVNGGEPESLISEASVGQYGTLSPDGRTIAFSSRSGIFVMQPDGSDVRLLLEQAASDSLSWTP